ncbi:hypothetical protein A9Q91_02485 [Candidatus Gracilibacteria bacterium 28_42_T64]|nr:hypothetical protein A9Q91_02485 [Candidatus Gracilibacteria bacterium 28_42_T64]
MQELYGLRETQLDYIIIPIIALLLGVIIYSLFLKYLQDNKGSKKAEEMIVEEHFDPVDIIYKKLQVLKKESHVISKDIFYKEVNDIFREYFVLLGVSGAFQSTLKELEKSGLPNELLVLFKRCYYQEFSLSLNSMNDREDIIEDFIKILQK